MNCVLFAKVDQVFSKKNKTLKKYWKSQGILSVRKSGNHEYLDLFLINEAYKKELIKKDKCRM